jgi:hypothetical protein
MKKLSAIFILFVFASAVSAQKIYSGFSCSFPFSLNYIRMPSSILQSASSYQALTIKKRGQLSAGSGFQLGGYTAVNYRRYNISLGFSILIYKRAYYSAFFPYSPGQTQEYRGKFGPDFSVNFPALFTYQFNTRSAVRPFAEAGISYNWLFAGTEEEVAKKSDISGHRIFFNTLYNDQSHFCLLAGTGLKIRHRYFSLQYSMRLNGLPDKTIVSDLSLLYRVDLRGRKKTASIYFNR